MRTILNYLIGRRKTIDKELTIDETFNLLKNIGRNYKELKINIGYFSINNAFPDLEIPYSEKKYSAEEGADFVKRRIFDENKYYARHKVYANKKVEKHYIFIEHLDWKKYLDKTDHSNDGFLFFDFLDVDFLIKKPEMAKLV